MVILFLSAHEGQDKPLFKNKKLTIWQSNLYCMMYEMLV